MNSSSPILLVDDDQNDVILTELAFKASGVSNPFLVVCGGHEALNYLKGVGVYAERKKYPMPGLLLLDLSMPLLTGFDVLEWLRGPLAPRVAVIVLTSSANPADIERARSLGAADYWVKPGNSADLIPMFRALGSRWLAPVLSPATAALTSAVPNGSPRPMHV